VTTFTWVPEFGSQKQVKPNVAQIKFGDSYEQRVANGLNVLQETWSLSFANREPSESASILAFLEARSAIEAFAWTPPDSGTEKAFVCRDWTVMPQRAGRFTISASFMQVFEP
jgi:phage-related protein